MDNIIALLQDRGLIEALTAQELQELAKKPLKLYCGFDPTGDSLHLGHLVGVVVLSWFKRYGHQPVALVGGATGMIGDPSGKSAERNLLTREALSHNVASLERQLNGLLNRDTTDKLPMKNNYDWFSKFSLLEFLREVGKHFRLGVMLSKEMVRTRLQNEEGMSFTEFSYQLLQGYDFYHLYKEDKVTLQIGGSDQWGNITAGTDLIKKLTGEQAYGLTFPLLTKSDGTKFGKSEKGAVWLSADKLSPYDFYQYLYRVHDDDVVKLLRMLTFLPMEQIRELGKKLNDGSCLPNELQKILAEEVTRFVHGDEGVELARNLTNSLSPGKETTLSRATFEAIANEMPTLELAPEEVIDRKLLDICIKAKLFESKGDAKRMVRNGGLYLNNKKITDENSIITHQDVVEGLYLLIAAGKKNKIILKINQHLLRD
ncbi:MAG: tyrosine--tRNA ligase [Parachlamydiales bacterium]|jgi:tyrosyl-tRNA synthetase